MQICHMSIRSVITLVLVLLLSNFIGASIAEAYCSRPPPLIQSYGGDPNAMDAIIIYNRQVDQYNDCLDRQARMEEERRRAYEHQQRTWREIERRRRQLEENSRRRSESRRRSLNQN